MIEFIDLEESKENEVTNSPNFKESQKLALKGYNSRQKYDEEIFQVSMVQNSLNSNNLDARQHSQHIRNSPNRFGNNNLTIQSVLYHIINSSEMIVATVDNLLTSHTDTKVKEINFG